MVGNIIYSLLKGKLWSDHRIGWRENFNRKPLYLMVKPMGFLVKIFPWKPIHWTSSIVDTWKIFSVCPSWLSRIFPYEKNVTGHPVIHWENQLQMLVGSLIWRWDFPALEVPQKKIDDWCLEIQELLWSFVSEQKGDYPQIPLEMFQLLVASFMWKKSPNRSRSFS